MEDVLLEPGIDIASLYRTDFNEVMQEALVTQGWQNQPAVFNEMESLSGKREDRVPYPACIVAQNP